MEKYNALTDKLNGKYDLIFADAVLLHFTYAQCERILTDRKNHLTNNGKVSRCVQL